jgi:hypothetical protein
MVGPPPPAAAARALESLDSVDCLRCQVALKFCPVTLHGTAVVAPVTHDHRPVCRVSTAVDPWVSCPPGHGFIWENPKYYDCGLCDQYCPQRYPWCVSGNLGCFSAEVVTHCTDGTASW